MRYLKQSDQNRTSFGFWECIGTEQALGFGSACMTAVPLPTPISKKTTVFTPLVCSDKINLQQTVSPTMSNSERFHPSVLVHLFSLLCACSISSLLCACSTSGYEQFNHHTFTPSGRSTGWTVDQGCTAHHTGPPQTA